MYGNGACLQRVTANEIYRYTTVSVYWRYYKLHMQPKESKFNHNQLDMCTNKHETLVVNIVPVQ